MEQEQERTGRGGVGRGGAGRGGAAKDMKKRDTSTMEILSCMRMDQIF